MPVLRAPVVHDHDGVDVGRGPRLDLAQVVLVQPPQQLEELGRLLGQVDQRLLHRPDEAQPLERPHQRAGQHELIGGRGRTRCTASRSTVSDVVRRAEALEVATSPDERLADDADDAAVDVVEPAAPLVDVEALLVAARRRPAAASR